MTAAPLDAMIQHYAASHRNPRNEIIHCICVPAIVFAVIGLIQTAGIGVALLAIAAAILYYSRLAASAAVEMAITLVVMLTIWTSVIPAHHHAIIALIIFILAWIGQFIGHAYEGAKPSFLEDLQYLMIGPPYVLAVLKQKLRRGAAA